MYLIILIAFDGCTTIIINHLPLHLIGILELPYGIQHEVQPVIIQFLSVLPPQTRELHYAGEAEELRVRGVVALDVAPEVEDLEVF